MAYEIKNGYLKSLKVEKTLYENYCHFYSEDTFSKFLIECLKKAVDKKDFFEFCLFDDIDDFQCNRSILMDNVRGKK